MKIDNPPLPPFRKGRTEEQNRDVGAKRNKKIDKT
jgi:hypothetical protein